MHIYIPQNVSITFVTEIYITCISYMYTYYIPIYRFVLDINNTHFVSVLLYIYIYIYMRQVLVTLFFCALPTITIVSGLTMAKTASSASGSAEDWTKEVLDLEKAGVCTKDSWTHIWNDPEGAHKDFPAKHLSRG